MKHLQELPEAVRSRVTDVPWRLYLPEHEMVFVSPRLGRWERFRQDPHQIVGAGALGVLGFAGVGIALLAASLTAGGVVLMGVVIPIVGTIVLSQRCSKVTRERLVSSLLLPEHQVVMEWLMVSWWGMDRTDPDVVEAVDALVHVISDRDDLVRVPAGERDDLEVRALQVLDDRLTELVSFLHVPVEHSEVPVEVGEDDTPREMRRILAERVVAEQAAKTEVLRLKE